MLVPSSESESSGSGTNSGATRGDVSVSGGGSGRMNWIDVLLNAVGQEFDVGRGRQSRSGAFVRCRHGGNRYGYNREMNEVGMCVRGGHKLTYS